MNDTTVETDLIFTQTTRERDGQAERLVLTPAQKVKRNALVMKQHAEDDALTVRHREEWRAIADDPEYSTWLPYEMTRGALMFGSKPADLMFGGRVR